MKKYIILSAAALLALAACSKVTPNAENNQRQIKFQVANYVNTKATQGLKFENPDFGTYAWFNATDPFMENEKVGLVSGEWTTVNNVYYWPKTGSIDFVSFSPFDAAPTVAKGTAAGSYTMTFANYEVTPEQPATTGTTGAAADPLVLDLMYADVATASANVDEITDDLEKGTTDSGYTGVPTLFHHALAKVGFTIQANFLEYEATLADGSKSKTSWKITLNSAKLQKFNNKGTLALTWASGAWTGSWAPTADVTELDVMPGAAFDLDVDATPLKSDLFVLPQTLAAQELVLNMTIETTLANGLKITETYEPVVSLKDITTAWGMNQITNYVIKIKPTASDEIIPHDDDPEDVVITFDPAVVDWTTVTAETTIQL